MSQSLRIGIDLGGSKIEGIALDASGTFFARRRIATPAGDYAATIAAVAALVHEIEAETGLKSLVGVGTPGAVSAKTGGMKNANSTCLNGRPLPADLKAAIGRPVRCGNDANCFALSEATDGAARDAGVVFGVILGTGVGGAIVHDKAVLEGANAIAGEWGHNPIPWPLGPDEIPGHPCYCGKTGCIETLLSGPGLVSDHLRHAKQTLTAQEIAQAAAEGDFAAGTTLGRYVDRLARGLAAVINLVDPDAVVLGGGLSQIAALYDQVPKLWGQYIFSDTVTTRLLPPLHGDSSGVRGAAWLWRADEL